MNPAELPAQLSRDLQRLQCLAELGLAEPSAAQQPDAVLDGLARCAAHLLGFPVALVTLVGDDRVWFKARYGTGLADAPRDTAFCSHALLGDMLFEVVDARVDPRFRDSPCVRGDNAGDLRLRAYAGLPIRVDGVALGTLCVADTVPRRLDAVQATLLADLANAVGAWFSQRRDRLAAERASAGMSARLARASHQMRTPLNAVLGFSQLLLMDGEALTPRQQERLGWMLSSARRLHLLVDGLLAADRCGEGGDDLAGWPTSPP